MVALTDDIQGYLWDIANQDKLEAVSRDLMEIDTCSPVPNYLLDVQTSIMNGNLQLAPLILQVDSPESSEFTQFSRHQSGRPCKKIRRLQAGVSPHSWLPYTSCTASIASSTAIDPRIDVEELDPPFLSGEYTQHASREIPVPLTPRFFTRPQQERLVALDTNTGIGRGGGGGIVNRAAPPPPGDDPGLDDTELEPY